MASCGSGACAVVNAGSCCIPVPQSVANQLGFVGGHPCCTYPCVQFPPFSVTICLQVNSRTAATIEQGCNLATDGESCQLYFPAGVTQDSWGKRCRTISWQRQVPYGAYIRIRLCAVDGCQEQCTSDSYTQLDRPNALIKFQVNGTSYLGLINSTATSSITGGDGGVVDGSCYVKAACIGTQGTGALDTNDTCCQWTLVEGETDNNQVSWGFGGLAGAVGTDNLPFGTEIILGPIGVVQP